MKINGLINIEKLSNMKNIIKITVISLMLGVFIAIASVSFAQPPNPPSGHGSGTNQSPGGGIAPIGSGIVILISLGAAYGVKKVYHLRKNKE